MPHIVRRIRLLHEMSDQKAGAMAERAAPMAKGMHNTTWWSHRMLRAPDFIASIQAPDHRQRRHSHQACCLGVSVAVRSNGVGRHFEHVGFTRRQLHTSPTPMKITNRKVAI